MRQLLIATRNAHKTREFAEILGRDYAISDLNSEHDFSPPEETGQTFAENAKLKALAASRRFRGLVVADDSGLEVDALDGAPGIYSARYSGETASGAKNIAKLLAELKRSSAENFDARFCCVIAVARDGKIIGSYEGFVEGTIVNPPRGSSGFGYDPIFQPNGYTKTFAELSAEEKNRISHRAKAIQSLGRALLK
jgi:XTP/dITP diphosphohydrolase